MEDGSTYDFSGHSRSVPDVASSDLERVFLIGSTLDVLTHRSDTGDQRMLGVSGVRVG